MFSTKVSLYTILKLFLMTVLCSSYYSYNYLLLNQPRLGEVKYLENRAYVVKDQSARKDPVPMLLTITSRHTIDDVNN